MVSKLKVLSLFSGIGGIELGLDRAGGFETVAFCEMDKHCHKILGKHWPAVPIFKDVNTLKVYDGPDGNCYLTDTLDENGYPINCITPEIDVITGGFPCTDVSFAGNAKGFFDENGNRTRSGLWKEYARLIEELRPKYCIIENVGYLRKNGLGIVLADLARIGYDAEWSVITANSVGYPHQRERLFIIAYPSSQRQYECSGQERHIQVDEEWSPKTVYADREGCKLESLKIRPVLSRGVFNSIRSTYPDERTSIAGVRRVTDGVPQGVHESERKQRIKQLGNAVVPRIAEIIGRAILLRESDQ